MADPHHDPHAMAPTHHDSHAHPEEHGPSFGLYVTVFVTLSILTMVSFGAYELLGHGPSSMWVILCVSVAKATLVAMIFMHLKYDWGKVFCIVIPVSVMAVLMIIVLLPDLVLAWHHIDPRYVSTGP